jgi:hypothetical protein
LDEVQALHTCEIEFGPAYMELIHRAIEKDQKMGSNMELHKMCLGSFHLFSEKRWMRAKGRQ